jgi:hypothetical protein
LLTFPLVQKEALHSEPRLESVLRFHDTSNGGRRKLTCSFENECRFCEVLQIVIFGDDHEHVDLGVTPVSSYISLAWVSLGKH